MTVTTEQLMAYADGELPPEESRLVEAALAQDAALRAQYERQKALAHTLHSAFAPVLDAPLPDRLLQAARKKTALQSLRALFAAHPFSAGGSLAGAALAFGLVLGVFVVPQGGGDFAGRRDGLVARAGLARALDTQLAANQDRGAPATVGISFRDGKGRYCRTFTAGSNAGIACHQDGGWQIAALAPASHPAGNGSYRMAAGEMPDAVRDAVTAMMHGSALNADEESRARGRNWQP